LTPMHRHTPQARLPIPEPIQREERASVLAERSLSVEKNCELTYCELDGRKLLSDGRQIFRLNVHDLDKKKREEGLKKT